MIWRKRNWILPVFVITCALLTWGSYRVLPIWKLASKGPRLEYVFGSNRRAISTSPLDSDSLVNAGHMEQLIGTLVKQGAGGRLEPYLATAWTVTEDYRTWRFRLREGATCEDGQPIDPAGFKRALERNLRLYAQNSVPVFQDLVGWETFLKGGALGGLAATSDGLSFTFTHPTKTGVLEFLGMPYYGFFCDRDYTADGRWKDPKAITSSGAYALVELEPDGTSVRIRKRPGWFSLAADAPAEVRITQKELGEALHEATGPRIVFGFTGGVDVPPNLIEVPSIPDILIAVVLSPNLKNLFHETANRHVFYTRFRAAQKKYAPPDATDLVSQFFYPSAKSELPEVDHPAHFGKPLRQKIRVVMPDHLSEKHQRWLTQILGDVFADVGVAVDFERMNREDPHALQALHANSEYDVRIAGVSIGGNFLNWVIDMMFCSKLGVSFPDPSGRVCQLVREFDRTGLSLVDYTKRFNAALHEDMVVIPVLHRRYSWLLTPDLDYALSPVSGSPRFDLIKVKP